MNWNFQIKHSKRSNRNANTLRVARPWAARTQPLLAMCAQPMRSSHSCCIPIASLRTHWCSLRAPALIARGLSLAVRARHRSLGARHRSLGGRHRSLCTRAMLGAALVARELALAAREAARSCARQCALWRSSLAAHTRLPCLAFAHAHSSIAHSPRHKAGLLPCARAPWPCSLHSYRMGDELPCSSSHARTIQHPLRVTRSVHCFVRASYMSESHKI